MILMKQTLYEVRYSRTFHGSQEFSEQMRRGFNTFLYALDHIVFDLGLWE